MKRELYSSNKANTQAFQMSNGLTATAGHYTGNQIKIKEDHIMAVVNKGQNNKTQYRDQYKRKTNEHKNNVKSGQKGNHVLDVDGHLNKFSTRDSHRD